MLLFVALALTGCRHGTTRSPATGASSFTFVEAGKTAADQVIVGDVGEPSEAKYSENYSPAFPLKPMVLPVYPPRALAAKAGAATVGVRLKVDAAGRVAEVGPSLLVYSTPGPFADDFLEAVKIAVKQWRFRPATIEQIERVQTPEVTYNRIVRSEKTESQFDLAFNFTATGGVETGK
jgi:outer membrane biosynthesis protein TonB